MRILIVDDHPIYRKGLVTLFDQMEPDGALLQAKDAAEAMVIIAEHDDLDGQVLLLTTREADQLKNADEGNV